MRKCHVPTRSLFLFFVSLAAFFLLGCPRLPRNFETLSLEEKVAAYEEHLSKRGRLHLKARSFIAWHGWDAADLMSEYLSGDKTGLPKYEAILIIRYVASRGCCLRGSAAENALKDFLEDAPAAGAERLAAEVTLRAINADMDPDSFTNYPPGGPCKEGRETAEERQ